MVNLHRTLLICCAFFMGPILGLVLQVGVLIFGINTPSAWFVFLLLGWILSFTVISFAWPTYPVPKREKVLSKKEELNGDEEGVGYCPQCGIHVRMDANNHCLHCDWPINTALGKP